MRYVIVNLLGGGIITQAEDCKNIILSRLYNMLTDEYCFYRYHINDKVKNEYGETVSTINELILKRPDTKMIKEVVDILNSLQKDEDARDTAQTGVIILSPREID
ncbi:MAG: hypothetical protein GYA87_05295 [Christensenellaceae bacterium]|nr:hypothetical protein [Christensenellaceae bacterium]